MLRSSELWRSRKQYPRKRQNYGIEDLNFVHCPYDGPILEAYKGRFSNVYVALHPFLKPKSIPLVQLETTCPTKFQIVQDCEPISWAYVVANSDFESISELDVALRCSIHGVNKRSHREDLVDLLGQTTEKLGIVPPDEGNIAPHVELEVWNGLKTSGVHKAKIADEFGYSIEEHELEGIFEKDCIPPHGVVFNDDYDFHIASHWDSHCTFIALKTHVAFPRLESFKCNESTQVYWGFFQEGNPHSQ